MTGGEVNEPASGLDTEQEFHLNWGQGCEPEGAETQASENGDETQVLTPLEISYTGAE